MEDQVGTISESNRICWNGNSSFSCQNYQVWLWHNIVFSQAVQSEKDTKTQPKNQTLSHL